MDSQQPIFVVLLGAALTGGLATLAATKWFEKRAERRRLYAEAYKVVLAWQEMLYRVRRRSSGEGAERALIEKFHGIQEDFNFYEGLISSESTSMGRSYKDFVKKVKDENETLIQKAWEGRIRKPRDGTPKSDQLPDISEISEKFLRDTRHRLAWWQLPKLLVWWDNRTFWRKK